MATAAKREKLANYCCPTSKTFAVLHSNLSNLSCASAFALANTRQIWAAASLVRIEHMKNGKKRHSRSKLV